MRKIGLLSKQLLPKLIILLLWGILCYWFFQSHFKYHFFYQEQNQLFLLDTSYLHTYFCKPAWFACMTGDYLTQFYYYLYAGSGILTITILLMGTLAINALSRCLSGLGKENLWQWTVFAIGLILMIIEARLSLCENYRLSSIIGLTAGFGLWIVYDMVKIVRKYWFIEMPVLLAVTAFAFWAFGIGWISFLCCEMIYSIVKTANQKRRMQAMVFIVAASAFYSVVLPFMATPYYINKSTAATYPGMGKFEDYNQALLFEKCLAYDNEYYWGHYDVVMQMYERDQSQMTDNMCFFYCLSLAKMNTLPEKITTMKNPYLGTFTKIDDKTPMFTIKMINELYYLIGDMTYAERAALLANTFSPNGRNVRMIKRLAETNLISGDIPAATKYLRLLEKTLAYHGWAKDHTPGSLSAPVKMEIEQKRKFLNTNDDIRLGDDCYTILTQLLDSNPNNLVALDYLLCSDMLSRQKDTFISDYEKYDGSRRTVFEQIYNSAKQ